MIRYKGIIFNMNGVLSFYIRHQRIEFFRTIRKNFNIIFLVRGILFNEEKVCKLLLLLRRHLLTIKFKTFFLEILEIL